MKITTTPIQDKLDLAFGMLAEVRLHNQSKSLDSNSVAVEAARIERCVEYFYKSEKHDLQYPEYALQFIQVNCKDILGGKYDGEWLNDIKDVDYVEVEGE
jgi:hypothetical protein